MAEELLTCSVPEAGQRLGIGRRLAYEQAKTGKIPTMRFGKVIRVPLKALERMVDEASKA